MRGFKNHAAQRGLPTKVAAAALLGASALAGCGGGDDQAAGNGNNNGSSGPNACDNFFGGNLPGAGSAASHGAPTSIDSDVLITDECTTDNPSKHVFHASKIVQRSNDFGGATLGDVTFQTDTGVIDSCVANAGGYRVRVMMEASGPNEQAARAALDHITVTHSDSLAAGKLTLNTKALITQVTPPNDSYGTCSTPGTGGQPGSPGFPGTGGGQPGTGGQTGTGGSFSTIEPRATIFAALPGTPSYVFKHTSQTGSIFAKGFSGTEVDFTSDNGQLDLVGGHWDLSNLTADEGAINVSGDHAALTATTTDGAIKATLATVRSVDAHVNAGLGDAEVVLQPTGTPGFDLFASTNSGTATVNVLGTGVQTVSPAPTPPADAKHSKTADFDTHGVKVTVHASSQNGDVSIHE